MTEIANIPIEKEGEITIVALSDDAKKLIEKHEQRLKERLSSDKFKPRYDSIDAILTEKYHLTDIRNLGFPDYRNRTKFIKSDGFGGELQYVDNMLSYSDCEAIINEGLNIIIP